MSMASETLTVIALVTLLLAVVAPVAPLVFVVVLEVASLTVTTYVPAVVEVSEVRTPLLMLNELKSVPDVMACPFFVMDWIDHATPHGPAVLESVIESECPSKE